MIDINDVLAGVAIGIGATLLMDLWNLMLLRVFGIPSLDYCLLGRWVLHIPRGTVRHEKIAAATPQKFECAAGWISHYTIGIAFGIAFVCLTEGWLAHGWLTRPTPGIALLFGITTVVFPFLLLQPALGFGIASSRAAQPRQARLKSLATHTVFGIGLYVWGWVLAGLS